MRYWPMYAVADAMAAAGSPYAAEIRQTCYKIPSEPAFYAALDMALQLPAVDAPNLVIIETEGTSNVRAFTARPGATEWLRLERAAVMQADDGFVFAMMDRLH